MTRPSIEDVLGPEGLLASQLPRYEFRPQQIEMALAVEAAIKDENSLIVEAATGTGKTLAYLVPALLSNRRVVVSTGTKNLQEQLFTKDIPLLEACWPSPFTAVQLKGRRNYLCQLRFDQMLFHPRFRGASDAKHWESIEKWAYETIIGDRAEIEGLPDNYPTWMDLSVSSENCLGTRCQHYETCFVHQARRRAQEARLIVVNHHLFFADLALRKQGFGEILPEYDVVIFDEAHHLESVASNYFGMEVSNYRINELVNDVQRSLDDEELTDDDIEATLKMVGNYGANLFSLLAYGHYDGRYELDELLERGQQEDKIGEAHRLLAESFTELERELERVAGRGNIPDRLPQRAAELKFEFDSLLRADDERYTYFVEIRDRGVFLQAAPIDLAELFRQRLLATHDAMVFTSATLSTNNDFEYFKGRLGILPPLDAEEESELLGRLGEEDDEFDLAGKLQPGEPYPVEELILPPVFDYASQSLLYVPRKMPAPRHPDFPKFVAQVVEYFIRFTQGRAFVLFTSYANLNAVFDILEPQLEVPMLKQGDAPKSELLRDFREDPSSVLFATSSFWEGVDVVGDALSLVVIDKLPFASPGDPLIRARSELLKSRGGNPFMEYSVPQAALTLKQGFGRLIRSREDKGVVAILDSRIAHKRYGKIFLETLPPAPVVWTAPEVKRWWLENMTDEEE